MREHVRESGSRKGSKSQTNTKQNTEKKPFDKKKYRLQKYSNKYKINQWEERRKKAVLRDFYKEVDKSQRQNEKKPLHLKNEAEDEANKNDSPKKIGAFQKAKQEFLRMKNEKTKKKEEALRMKSEREEALQKYKEKKMQAFKKLSKKTRKGQPVMKDRLEMLLERIQQNVSN